MSELRVIPKWRRALRWPSILLTYRRAGLTWRAAWRQTHWVIWYPVLLLFFPAMLAAQPAPLVGSTLRTTSTAAGSVRVGCTQSGACTGGVTAGPIDVASVTSAGFIGIASNVPGVTTMRLYNNAGTLTWNGTALAAGSSLSGTLNTIPVFTSANSVGNSIITQNVGATLITVAGEFSVARGTAGIHTTTLVNSVSGAAAMTRLQLSAGTNVGILDIYSQGWSTTGSAVAAGTRLANFGVGGIALASVNAVGNIGFYTGAASTLRWAVNTDGEWTVGPSTHIVDSAAAPTLAGCGSTGTITGNNTAFTVTADGAGISSSCTITFNATYANPPTCVFMSANPGRVFAASPSTTQVLVAGVSSSVGTISNFGAGEVFYGMCRGF